MYQAYRGAGRRRPRLRRGTLLVLLLLTAVFLVSCVAGSNPLWIKGLFGIDVANYDAEPTEALLPTDGETAASLCDTVEILLSGSTQLKTFRNTSQAVKYYRDAILNDMLRDHYVLYTGNTQLLSEASRCYPQVSLSTLIPKSDFENRVFRYFGGTNVSHRDGEVFSYLSRVEAYTAPLQAWEAQVEIAVLSLEETAHTYRMSFTLSDGSAVSAPYTAHFIKRDDGSAFLNSLS